MFSLGVERGNVASCLFAVDFDPSVSEKESKQA